MSKIERNKGYSYEKDGVKVSLVDSPETTERIRKRARVKKITGWSVFSVLLFVFLLNIVILPVSSGIPRVEDITSYNGDNPYIVFDERTQISAHRAGGDLAPEETMAAFKLCMTATDYVVDIVEFDLHLTADDKLVLLHDHELDRTSDSERVFGKSGVKVSDKTLAELKQLNMGANFKDPYGRYPYRGLDNSDPLLDDVRILSLNEVIEYLQSVRGNDLQYIIEIKDGDDRGRRSMDILYETMVRYEILDNTIVGTFKGEISKYIDEKYPDVVRSAGIAEVLDFYYAYLYNVDLSKRNVKYSVLQIPYKDFVINLGKPSIIDYAHKYDIAVQYWTINDATQIRELQQAGADAIMTDNPAVAYEVIFGSKAA